MVQDAPSEGGANCVEAGGMLELSIPLIQFCCEPKSPLKK
jgi:hypothetical protein